MFGEGPLYTKISNELADSDLFFCSPIEFYSKKRIKIFDRKLYILKN